jgi:hypothetical protein
MSTVLTDARSSPRVPPPTSEVFTRHQLAQRHPHLLSDSRIAWALRNRRTNGLGRHVFESRAGELLVHEPGFLTWYFNLEGRGKPRALRGKRAARAT